RPAPTDTPVPQSTTVSAVAGTPVVVGSPDSGLSARDPVGTSLTTASDGTVSITESATTSAPSAGYELLGQQIVISAPPATDPSHPLQMVFRLDASQVPPGEDA